MKRYIYSMAENKPIATRPVNWICSYILYSLYLRNSAKFEFSVNGTSATGDNSGYVISLKSNTQGVTTDITFQLTPKSADQVHLKGGIHTNYIDVIDTANAVIRILLAY